MNETPFKYQVGNKVAFNGPLYDFAGIVLAAFRSGVGQNLYAVEDFKSRIVVVFRECDIDPYEKEEIS